MDKNNEEYIYYVVANNIRKYRKQTGIIQAILAERADLSHEFIMRIESKKGVKNLLFLLYIKLQKFLIYP